MIKEETNWSARAPEQIVWPLARLLSALAVATLVSACGSAGMVDNSTGNKASVTSDLKVAGRISTSTVSASRSNLSRPDDEFQFVIVGDRTGGHRPGVFDRAMRQLNHLRPEFVIGVGDMIEGYTEGRDILAAEWDELEGMVDQLHAPFFYVAGNHDISNDTMESLWEQRRGPRYYHFIYADVLFLVLNTEDPAHELDAELQAGMAEYKRLLKTDPDKAQKMIEDYQQSSGDKNMAAALPVNISDEQLAYMQAAIADNSEVRWTFVFMHKPAWHFNSDTFKSLEQGLQGRPYTMVAGHNHYYQHSERFGQDYIVMGTTGGTMDRRGPGQMDHISWVTMTPEGPDFAVLELDGLHDKYGREKPAAQ